MADVPPLSLERGKRYGVYCRLYSVRIEPCWLGGFLGTADSRLEFELRSDSPADFYVFLVFWLSSVIKGQVVSRVLSRSEFDASLQYAIAQVIGYAVSR